ncbi:terpene synthase family protein [Chitinophaga solisilvae]|uniref:terpene synthase family protein n=1 Tax=Chitinophaga solisilvae TaxID=1233460 RepID=UPI0013709E06|nr:terpene synthase family protein [Chitinophaga solisilvae]
MRKQKIAELLAPFPPRINRFANESRENTRKWVEKFKLHEGSDFDAYLKDNLTYMTARFYPTAPKERFFIADQFNTLLFAMDDRMDHQDNRDIIISSKERFTRFIDACLLIMKGEYKGQLPATGHLAALHDVWTKVKTISTPAWQEKFISSISKMFDAALWAHDNVAARQIPSIAAFYTMRPFLGAAHTSTDMIEIIEEVHIPNTILDLPYFQEITRLCQITVCIANDMFSVMKEIGHQDYHNMVVIMMQEKDIHLKQAMKETRRLYNADMRQFLRLMSINSHQLFTGYEAEILRYKECLQAIMRGNIDWSSKETNRYTNFVYGKSQLVKRKEI